MPSQNSRADSIQASDERLLRKKCADKFRRESRKDARNLPTIKLKEDNR